MQTESAVSKLKSTSALRLGCHQLSMKTGHKNKAQCQGELGNPTLTLLKANSDFDFRLQRTVHVAIPQNAQENASVGSEVSFSS